MSAALCATLKPTASARKTAETEAGHVWTLARDGIISLGYASIDVRKSAHLERMLDQAVARAS